MRAKKEIRVVVGLLSIVVFWVGYGIVQYVNKQSPDYISPAEMRSKDRALIQISPDLVEYIVIEEAGLQPLLESKIKISDREGVNRIVKAINDAERITVNHPSTIWECYFTLILPDEVRKIRISKTGNQGLIVWGYSQFRCDGLGPILEEIAIQNSFGHWFYRQKQKCSLCRTIDSNAVGLVHSVCYGNR